MTGPRELRRRAGLAAAVFREVGRNSALRRAVAAYAGFNFGEWATWIAILVYAFERGGAAEAGVVALVQLAPAVVVAPLAASLGDRYRRDRALLVSYLVQAGAMSLTAVTLALGAPSPVVYAAAVLTALSVTLTRPAHGSLLPTLARTPSELTAANVASGSIQYAALLAAPAVAGLLLESAGAAAVFVVSAVGVAGSALLVASMPVPEAPPDRPAAEVESRLDELVGGFRVLVRQPGPRTVVGLLAAAAAMEGVLDVLVVVLALDLLLIGESGVGFLNSALGLGGIVGATLAVALVGRSRLAGPLALGLLLYGLPLVAIGVAPSIGTALLLVAVCGLGRSLSDVAGRTLLQRVTPDAALSRVFGILEGFHMGVVGIGSIAVPALIAVAGGQQAIILAGLWIPLVLLVRGAALRRVDQAAAADLRELGFVRAVPMFAPLAPQTLEYIASNLVPIDVAAGSWIVREGEVGERFYLIAGGEVEVLVDGHRVRTEGPGEAFGEIALLRDVPRTASVRALAPTRLLALDRDVFLAAVTNHATSRRLADDLIATRLATG